MYCVQKVFDTLLAVLELSLHCGYRGVLPALQFDDGIGNAVDVFVSQDVVHGQQYSHSLYPVFADGFTLTAQVSLFAVAFVIMILPAFCPAGAALSDHHTAAGTTE